MAEANIVSVSQTSFRLKIPKINSLVNVYSPIQVVQDIPWKVKVFKSNHDEKQSLGISLHCAKSDNSSNWSHAASVSFKLLSFDGLSFIEGTSEPYAFNYAESSIGFPSFIEWSDLLDLGKNFVKDDSIQLDIKIEAADPHEVNQSMLVFEELERCCENDCLAVFRLTVVNINTLMAVRSPQFVLRGLLWDLSVYKDHSAQLGVRLGSRITSDQVSCKVRMTTKLISSKEKVKPVEKVEAKVVQRLQFLLADQLIEWKDLMKPENGFVESDSIVLEIEIKASKPEFITPNGMNDYANVSDSEVKPLKMECAICLESIRNQDISCPPCGHLFCTPCISKTAEQRKTCPSCIDAITDKSLRRVYLPIVN